MTHVTTHVLDAVRGVPAAGVAVELSDAAGQTIARGVTDADGRTGIGPDRLAPGEYALRFETGAYFAALAQETFYPSATVAFTLGERPHVHVPLLLSPFAYSTYRGS